jgi:twinfilin-like protein
VVFRSYSWLPSSNHTPEIPPPVKAAYDNFITDPLSFALLLQFSTETLQLLPSNPHTLTFSATFQTSLSQLEGTIDTKTPLYLIIRRSGSGPLTLITYIPYLADTSLKERYLSNRHSLLQTLGEQDFSISVICKEPGDITDLRAWEERDEHLQQPSKHDEHDHNTECETCTENGDPETSAGPKDIGHIKTKCRLCDRRMKNKTSPSAFEALQILQEPGAFVQLHVDAATETLTLTSAPAVHFELLPSHIPSDHPSFTFYRHPNTNLLYFIFFSPDSTPVKERMTHTMAIGGLVSVIAKEAGALVDRRIEIHDVEDLRFEEGKDHRIGRFRSMYLLNERKGTESLWEGMEEV